MAVTFPFVAVTTGRGDASLLPLLPLKLWLKGAQPIQSQGLLDSGAAVNVLPFELGLRLGAVWEAQSIRVTLTGNLAAQDARGLVVQAQVADYAPVVLVFAWTRAENVPLLLGQVNFFDAFDISFYRSQRRFELQPAAK